RIALQPRHLGVEARIGVRPDLIAVEVEIDAVADVDDEVLFRARRGRAQVAAVDRPGRSGRILRSGDRRGVAAGAVRGGARGAGGDGGHGDADGGEADEGRGPGHQWSPWCEASASSVAIKPGYWCASGFASRDNAKLTARLRPPQVAQLSGPPAPRLVGCSSSRGDQAGSEPRPL